MVCAFGILNSVDISFFYFFFWGGGQADEFKHATLCHDHDVTWKNAEGTHCWKSMSTNTSCSRKQEASLTHCHGFPTMAGTITFNYSKLVAGLAHKMGLQMRTWKFHYVSNIISWYIFLADIYWFFLKHNPWFQKDFINLIFTFTN